MTKRSAKVRADHDSQPNIGELAKLWADGLRVGPNERPEPFEGWLRQSMEQGRHRIADVACTVDNDRVGTLLDTPDGPMLVLYQPPYRTSLRPTPEGADKSVDFSTAMWRYIDPPADRTDLRGPLGPEVVCVVACNAKGHHHVGVDAATLEPAVAAYRATGRRQRILAPLYGDHAHGV